MRKAIEILDERKRVKELAVINFTQIYLKDIFVLL